MIGMDDFVELEDIEAVSCELAITVAKLLLLFIAWSVVGNEESADDCSDIISFVSPDELSSIGNVVSDSSMIGITDGFSVLDSLFVICECRGVVAVVLGVVDWLEMSVSGSMDADSE